MKNRVDLMSRTVRFFHCIIMTRVTITRSPDLTVAYPRVTGSLPKANIIIQMRSIVIFLIVGCWSSLFLLSLSRIHALG